MPRKKALIDYYRILQIHEEAEAEVVQAAYRTLSKKYHPDTNKEAHAEERMKQLNEAYAVLGDEQLRAEYDRQHHHSGKAEVAIPTEPKPATTRKKPPKEWDKDDVYNSSTRDETVANSRAKNYKPKSYSALGQEMEKVILTYGPQDIFWLARYVSQSTRTGVVSKAEVQAAIRADNGRVFKVAWTDNGRSVYDLAAI
ncbi:MAG: DnaJ domain-containing protein [Chloroflexota bacterium]|nr:DnaJ domain-containing protein [Chloroflexota bacterium]